MPEIREAYYDLCFVVHVWTIVAEFALSIQLLEATKSLVNSVWLEFLVGSCLYAAYYG